MAVTLRQTATDTGAKATALTHQEMNNNFKDFLTFTTATTSTGPYTISSVFAPILSATNGVRATGIFTANQISTGGMDYYSTTNGARFLSWGPAGVTGTFTWWSGQGNSGATQKMSLDGSGNLTVTATVNAPDFNSTSDLRLKENITSISGPDLVRQLNPVQFTWKDSGKQSYGLIAQEIENIFPELVVEREDGTRGVSYTPIIAMLVDAVKKLESRVIELENNKGTVDGN